MDTSKTYIDMSNHPKIQEQYNLKFGVSFFQKGESAYCDVYWENEKRDDDDIWLPRQDQVQEMILNATVDFDTSIAQITLLCNFSYFCGARNEDAEGRSNVSIRKESLEVLWLAFYMYKIHKKCWGGEEWEEWDKWENSQDYKYGFGLNEIGAKING